MSALPRSDLLLLSCAIPVGKIHTLPISPYPAQGGTPIRAHFIRYQKPSESSWTPWIGDTWGSWVQGKILGYRDFAGRETQVRYRRETCIDILINGLKARYIRCTVPFTVHAYPNFRLKQWAYCRRRVRCSGRCYAWLTNGQLR